MTGWLKDPIRQKIVAAVLLGVCAFSIQVTHAALTIIDIGAPAGSSSFGYSVNPTGQVAGIITTVTNNVASYSSFRTAANGGVRTDLGNLGYPHTEASGINNAGQVVGTAFTNSAFYYAFRTTSNGTVTAGSNLGVIPGGSSSSAFAINTLGQVTGSSFTVGAFDRHAFRTTATGNIVAGSDLGTLGGTDSYGYAINVSGQVTGGSYLSNNFTTHAFRTTATGGVAGTDLGDLGGGFSIGYGINNAGQVVGQSEVASTDYHAFRTTATGSIDAGSDLGTLGGTIAVAEAINNLGQVVGHSDTADLSDPNNAQHAFYVGATGSMIDLNSLLPANSGWELIDATAINDLGQITGYGDINGERHAFLITSLPEPATFGLFGAALLMMLRRRKVAVLSKRPG